MNNKRFWYNLNNLNIFNLEFIFDIIINKIDKEIIRKNNYFNHLESLFQKIIWINDEYLIKLNKIINEFNKLIIKNEVWNLNFNCVINYVDNYWISKDNFNNKIKHITKEITKIKSNINFNFYNEIKNIKLDKNKLTNYNNDLIENIKYYNKLKFKINEYCLNENINKDEYESWQSDSVSSLNKKEIELINKINEKNLFKKNLFNKEKRLIKSLNNYVKKIKNIQILIKCIKIENYNKLFDNLDNLLILSKKKTIKSCFKSFKPSFGKKLNSILNFIYTNNNKFIFLKKNIKILKK